MSFAATAIEGALQTVVQLQQSFPHFQPAKCIYGSQCLMEGASDALLPNPPPPPRKKNGQRIHSAHRYRCKLALL